MRLSEEEEAALFFKYDTDGNGTMNLREFVESTNPMTDTHKELSSSMAAAPDDASATMKTYREKLAEARLAGEVRKYEDVLDAEKTRTQAMKVQLEPCMIAFVTAFSKRKQTLVKNFNRYDIDQSQTIGKSEQGGWQ